MYNGHNSYSKIIDLLNAMGRSDRLCILFALEEHSYNVTDLTSIVHGSMTHNNYSQTSRALILMRRLGLVQGIHAGRFIVYELTYLGEKVADSVRNIAYWQSEQVKEETY